MSASYHAVLPRELEIAWLDESRGQQVNMDLEDEYAMEVASGHRPPLLRLWSGGNVRAIGVSRKDIQKPAGQRAAAQLAEAGCNVFVRRTGGTAVPQGPGVLLVSLMLPRLPLHATTDDYYRMLCDLLASWLDGYGLRATTGSLPGSYCDGNYNVLVGGRKLVGTAQAWRGGLAGTASNRPGYVLAHACVPIAIDMADASACINQFYAWSQADYRVDPSTAVSLRDLLPNWPAHVLPGVEDCERSICRLAADDLMEAAVCHFTALGVNCQVARWPVKPQSVD
ncbi:lipoate--protein ligase family protein [Alicyclobacillus sp. ALC3]|uniref:lipoate--protein ligase family protein n=1 Tax=Alicyclobacillus sp. ALC3 TaxID=2796143 RepID=UPI00237A07A9|nr:ligase [Alicyclobacillus sp. ALC3]WDL95870.1 ligase [Alicyclobacillus sp. ALC3]